MTAKTNPATLTYGDMFTIECTPGIAWKIKDRRTLDGHESHCEEVADATPHTLEGERLDYGAPVKIGRAERTCLEISFKREHDGKIRAWPSAGNYSAPGLTDAQRAAINAELAVLSFDLPPLTPAELIERAKAEITSAMFYAVREVEKFLPSYQNKPAQIALSEAVHAAGAMDELRRVAVAEFAAKIAEWRV